MSTLVALHGFCGAPRLFAALAPTIAPRLSGHGPAPDLSSQSFDAELKRLAGLLMSKNAGPYHLVGYSMGARVGLGLLLDYPQLFCSASLIGLNPGLSDDQERKARLDWEAGWSELLKTEGLAQFERRWSSLPLFSSQRFLAPEVAAQQRQDRLDHAAAGLCHALAVLGLGSMPNYWPRLSELSLPIDCISGSEDEKFASIAQHVAQCCPTTRAILVEKAGHNPLLEAPQTMNRLVAQAQEHHVDASPAPVAPTSKVGA